MDTDEWLVQKQLLRWQIESHASEARIAQTKLLIQTVERLIKSNKYPNGSPKWIDLLEGLPQCGASWWRDNKARTIMKELMTSASVLNDLPFSYNDASEASVPKVQSAPVLRPLMQ